MRKIEIKITLVARALSKRSHGLRVRPETVHVGLCIHAKGGSTLARRGKPCELLQRWGNVGSTWYQRRLARTWPQRWKTPACDDAVLISLVAVLAYLWAIKCRPLFFFKSNLLLNCSLHHPGPPSPLGQDLAGVLLCSLFCLI